MKKEVLYGVFENCPALQFYTHYEILQVVFIRLSAHKGQTENRGGIKFSSDLIL